jgi:RNA polymerase-binding transcription factor DksA
MKAKKAQTGASGSGGKTAGTRAKARATGAARPKASVRWGWHRATLSRLRERLIDARRKDLRAAAEPIEPHSLHRADSATDEFDHELVLSRLSADQDALYEVEAALKRIADGTYGVCEMTGKRIPAQRLKAVPWTRFREDVEARLEGSGTVKRPRLGSLRSVRQEAAEALAETEPSVEEPEHAVPAENPAIEPSEK